MVWRQTALIQAFDCRTEQGTSYVLRDAVCRDLAIRDPVGWEQLPDGSLIIVDEAQKYFPARRSEPTPPIKALSEHRHRGFDFVLVTQPPMILDSYVRKLVGEHIHVVRKFGTQVTERVTWSEVVDDPQSQAMRSRGQTSLEVSERFVCDV